MSRVLGWRSREYGWRSGCPENPKTHHINPHLLMPEMKIPACTPLVLTQGRESQAESISVALPHAPFNTTLFLSVVPGVARVGGE